MAAVTDLFELLKIARSQNVYTESLGNEDSILISSKENGFIAFNLESHKVLQSWALSQCKSLNAPAIFDKNTATYYCIMNEKELLSWKSEDSSPSQGSMTMLSQKNSYAKLQSISKENTSDVILFDKTGKAFLKSKLENQHYLGQSPCSPVSNTRYIWSDVVEKDDSSHVFVAVVTEEAQKYSLTVLMLKKMEDCFDFVESHKYLIDPVSKGCHVISCTLQKQKLVVLWSDNSIYSYELPLLAQDVLNTSTHPAGLIGKTLVHTLQPEFKVSGKGLSKAKIGSINQEHLFVVSKCIIGEKKQGLICIINTKFGTEQARTIFSLSSVNDTSSKDQDVLSARYCNGKVIVALSSSIICTECSVFSSCLASALGKLKSSDVVNCLKPEGKSHPLLIPRKLKRPFKDAEKAKMQLNEEEEGWKSIQKLGDPLKTPTVEAFNRELNLFLKKLHIRVTRDSSQAETERQIEQNEEPSKKKIKKELEAKDKRMMIPDQFVQTVVKRCVEDDTLWSSSVLNPLLKLRCISPRNCSDIITKCINTNSVIILKKCFKYTDGLSERDIVRSIQYILSRKTDKETWKKQQVLKGPTLPDLVKIEETSFSLLLKILNYPCNEYFLQEMLRNLSREETKELLQVLFELMARQLTNYKAFLSHEKVIDWISMIVNAKFTTIILSNDAYRLIKLIKKAARNQMNYFNRLQQVEPFLLQLKGTYKMPNIATPVGAYSVETITI